MLAFDHWTVSVSVLSHANFLAKERYNGSPLRDLEPEQQFELLAAAKANLDHYRMRKS